MKTYYIFIFEQGEISYSEIAPTLEDIQCVLAGVLTILKFEPGSLPAEMNNDGAWVIMDRANFDPSNGYHLP